MNVYITGDVHGDFDDLEARCRKAQTREDDIVVILGDVALNYSNDWKDYRRKKKASALGPKLFCVHGNHEMRPANVKGYELVDWHGGRAWIQPEFPNLIFAKDGEIYDLGGKKIIVLGGAYSTDKQWRLAYDYEWFPDEQPSDEIKQYAEEQLDRAGWKVDAVFSHTCPFKYRPLEDITFRPDQSKVDTSTEQWLDKIEDRLEYGKWYCGHWHINKRIDKMEFLFQNIIMFA